MSLPQASSLVYFLLFYAEDHTTQHMETLLQGLYKASQDENEQVVRQVTPYILQSANFPL